MAHQSAAAPERLDRFRGRAVVPVAAAAAAAAAAAHVAAAAAVRLVRVLALVLVRKESTGGRGTLRRRVCTAGTLMPGPLCRSCRLRPYTSVQSTVESPLVRIGARGKGIHNTSTSATTTLLQPPLLQPSKEARTDITSTLQTQLSDSH